MRLDSELKAIGFDSGTWVFQETVTDVWSAMNRDCSIDNFMCRPWDHREYCTVVRYRLGLDETCDDLILRTLLNMRKKRGGTARFERSSHLRLKTELEVYGYDIDPELFKRKIQSIFLDVYKKFSVDQLLMRWRDSLHFCALVRSELDLPKSLTINELVLRTLLNSRRKGALSLRSRIAA